MLILLGVCLYEAWRVVAARASAEKIFADILTSPDLLINHADISERHINILLKVEDPNFYTHDGLDFKTPGTGLTTITQALTKRLFFSDFKKGFAKIEQSLIAKYAVHPKIGKDDQLIAFFNIAYFGRCEDAQLYGFSDAALCYYGKEFSGLSQEEYIELVAMLIGPGRFNPRFPEKGLTHRTEKISRLITGQCYPKGLQDVYYEHC